MVIENYSYIGWIPTVAGRVSFRHLGKTSNPTVSKYSNVICKNDRYVISYQKRNLSDAIFKNIMSLFLNEGGDFWFCLHAQQYISENNRDLPVFGKIDIFATKKEWRHRSNEIMRSCIKFHNTYTNVIKRPQDVDFRYHDSCDAIGKKSDIRIGFLIERNGIIKICEPQFKSSDLMRDSYRFASNIGIDFEKWIVDQAYFFMRDIAHHHQHHSSTTDTILITQKITDGNDNWAIGILGMLFHYLVKSERVESISSLVRAKGIVSYIQSFLHIMDKKKLQKPDYYTVAISDSLDAKIKEKEVLGLTPASEIEFRIARNGSRRTYFVVLFGIFFAFIWGGVFFGSANNSNAGDIAVKIHDVINEYFYIIIYIGTITALLFGTMTSDILNIRTSPRFLKIREIIAISRMPKIHILFISWLFAGLFVVLTLMFGYSKYENIRNLLYTNLTG